jgi:endoglucanase
MSRLPINPDARAHSLPAIRGVMTEWMFTPGQDSTGRSTDPTGQNYDAGDLSNIREEDIALAAATGVNTFRCSIEHTSLEDRDEPGKYIEAGFQRIEQLLSWYAKYDLLAVLDIHNALGREGGGDPRLWEQTGFQDRFVALWRVLAERFSSHPQVVALELMNEPEPRHTDDWAQRYRVWNDLAKRATAAIREVDPAIPLIVDSIEYANPGAFEGLEPTGDPNTIYSFHWYDPSDFHKQRRPWLDDQSTYHYPGEYDGKWWDRRTILEKWRTPLDWAAKHNVRLFCGEFGCVAECPEMEDMVWLLDVISLMDQHRIDWTYFHYMFRTADPMWAGRFDCNMYMRDIDQGDRLRVFDRKVSLLGDLMKLRGDVLDHDQPDDPAMTAYAVRLADGRLRVYVSNTSGDDAKELTLELAGGDWAPQAHCKRMARGTGGFVDDAPRPIEDGAIALRLEPLTIQRLTLTPRMIFGR